MKSTSHSTNGSGVRLTAMVTGGGCAAKLGPKELSAAVSGLSLKLQAKRFPMLLVGAETLDDAGVYRLSKTRALVQTLDFFTPIVDNPFTFGEIAAANALSDVYAMGGRPLTAMNIVCFPRDGVDKAILGEILAGGLSKLAEAGAALVGGHSICDPEIKYGLAVTGLVNPQRLWTNAGAQPGDVLVLTKALGTGAIASALKQNMAPRESVDAAIESMRTLNAGAKKQAARFEVHACTDVTGFGLIGHLYQMMLASKVRAEINLQELPLLPHALEIARLGIGAGGTERNRAYAGRFAEIPDSIEPALSDLLFDPQTSGGLLLAMPPGDAARFVARRAKRDQVAVVIGRVRKKRAAEPLVVVTS